MTLSHEADFCPDMRCPFVLRQDGCEGACPPFAIAGCLVFTAFLAETQREGVVAVREHKQRRA